MKQIQLGKGKSALVDDEWFDYLSQFKWRLVVAKSNMYAARYDGTTGSPKTLAMHRAIMNPPAGMVVDHIDHDGLNNQVYNLRVCTVIQNQHNRLISPNCTSKYKGVSWSKRSNKWLARIQVNKQFKHLGLHTDEIAAALAYDTAARKYFGEYALTNFWAD